MTLLLIDTSTARCAAFVRQGDSDHQTIENGTRGQDARLAPMVRDLLTTAGLGPKDITRIGVIIGPGAFTGVRIGVSFARGLGLALPVPVMGINALDVFALKGADHRHSAGICDIGRDELAYRLCHNGALQGDYETAPAADAAAKIRAFGGGKPVYISGSAAAKISGDDLRDTGQNDLDMAAIADLLAVKALPMLEALPWYHRPPDAKLPGGITP
jgi:tRNA threonylcarbamoyladenosine biosynthesis protein TsaB